ncbi:hypothetical protein [Nostoc sp.]
MVGLAGLAGLARNREKVRAYSDPDEVAGSHSRK